MPLSASRAGPTFGAQDIRGEACRRLFQPAVFCLFDGLFTPLPPRAPTWLMGGHSSELEGLCLS
eukprot:7975941-Lingulodinium_polyedra.AAC.1